MSEIRSTDALVPTYSRLAPAAPVPSPAPAAPSGPASPIASPTSRPEAAAPAPTPGPLALAAAADTPAIADAQIVAMYEYVRNRKPSEFELQLTREKLRDGLITLEDLKLNLLGGPGSPAAEAFLQAEGNVKSAADQLEAARKTAQADLAMLEDLARNLDFKQGGDVDTLSPSRHGRFASQLEAARKALTLNPPDAEAYRAHLSHMRTILDPPEKPLDESGRSRHQRFWGKPVPGAATALEKLDGMVARAGYAARAVAGTLFALRGDVVQARSHLDTLRDRGQQAQRIEAKKAETAATRVEAAELAGQYGAARELATSSASSLLSRLGPVLRAYPGGAEALADLEAAGNAAKLGYWGATGQLLTRVNTRLAALAKTDPAVKAALEGGLGALLTDGIAKAGAAGKAWSASWRANNRLSKLQQEHQRMSAGYQAAVGKT